MWREFSCALALILLLLMSGQARAVDPQSTQAYCDEVRDAAKDAQKRYVSTFKPRQDPGKTFDDATKGCLDGILSFPSAFQFTMPTMAMVQEILKQMATKLLMQACQSAHDQFDRAVDDAMSTVDGGISNVNDQIPSGLGGVSYSTTTIPVAPGPVATPPAGAMSTVKSAWNSVVNFLTGKGNP